MKWQNTLKVKAIFILVRFSFSSLVALIATGACGWCIFVELVLLDEWLGRSWVFVQVNFEIVRWVLEILELLLNYLNFALFVSNRCLWDTTSCQSWNFNVLGSFPIVHCIDVLCIANRYVFVADFLIVQFCEYIDCSVSLQIKKKICKQRRTKRNFIFLPFWIWRKQTPSVVLDWDR